MFSYPPLLPGAKGRRTNKVRCLFPPVKPPPPRLLVLLGRWVSLVGGRDSTTLTTLCSYPHTHLHPPYHLLQPSSLPFTHTITTLSSRPSLPSPLPPSSSSPTTPSYPHYPHYPLFLQGSGSGPSIHARGRMSNPTPGNHDQIYNNLTPPRLYSTLYPYHALTLL